MRCQVTQKAANQDNEIRTLTKGDYFGEQVIVFETMIWVHKVHDDVAGAVEDGHEDCQRDCYQ